MTPFAAESGVEEVCLEYFADLDWDVLYGPVSLPVNHGQSELATGTYYSATGCGRP